jgi:thiamine biosynthesis lipoprotein
MDIYDLFFNLQFSMRLQMREMERDIPVRREMKKVEIMAALLVCITALTGCGGQNREASANSQTIMAGSTNAESTVQSTSDSDAADLGLQSELVENEDGSVSQDVFAMDTYMTVKAYGENASQAVQDSIKEIERIDALLSTGDENSEISKLNAEGSGTVSGDTEYLIERSLDLYASTEHAFDIAIYPVMELWGFPDQNYQVPSEEEIEETLKRTDASKISVDSVSHTVSFGQEGMEIDLGGIAKGYTGARIAEIFRQDGVENGILSLGGNVQAIGSKTDGSLWKVGIEDPDDSGDYLGVLSVSDKAAITSGGYERYFEQDGKVYHHIIDPATGSPAECGIKSSTIVSSDGTLADGLSTSLFIMGKDKAIEYWRANSQDFDFILEDEDGNLYVSEGISDSFSSDRNVNVIKKQS